MNNFTAKLQRQFAPPKPSVQEMPCFSGAVQGIGQPDDIYEQEAEAMADKVGPMSSTPMHQNTFFKPADNQLSRTSHAFESSEKNVRRKEESGIDVKGSNELDSYAGSLNSSGQPMPESSRNFFEPKFGHDFSNVKLHTDDAAAQSGHNRSARWPTPAGIILCLIPVNMLRQVIAVKS